MIGHTLGHYRILEKIGGGGMGVVYRARDERLERDVALKVLPSGALADESARKRFRKEALALSQINHPNIATVFDFDSQDNTDFLVMEFVSGATLAEKIGARPLAEKDVVSLGLQVAEALEEAHARGIIHRDLKPANIIVNEKGRAKVLDFGLAKLLRPVSHEAETLATVTETQAGSAAGTLPYMAPEQLRGEAVDGRTDLYAAGAVLYEMATAQRPFPETQVPLLINSILNRAPEPPRALNAHVSAGLESIIRRALEKDPGRRYQSAREFAADLERLSVGALAAGRAPGPRPFRHPLFALAGAAAGVIILLLAFNVGGWRAKLSGPGRSLHIESLAVLPLDNLSRDPEQDYFAEGMTEALITDLAKIGALKVISRTSVMQYKGTTKPLPQIGRELNVDAVVEGSVQRSGSRVRITAQLIEAKTDRHLWAESYERDMRDVLGLQSEVARAIAGEIQIKVTPQEKSRLAGARPVNPEAHEAYLRGRFYWNKRPLGVQKGLEYFHQAIEKDPTYAVAYAGLADSYSALGAWEMGALAPKEAYPKAKEAAEKALELDESLAEAHASRGFAALNFDWDWSGAERELKRAIALNPNFANGHHWYSHYLTAMGRTEESLTESQRALELDPLDVLINAHLAWHYIYARQYDQALAQSGKVIEMDANSFWGHFFKGWALGGKHKYRKAIPELQKAREISGGAKFALAALGHAYALAGRKREAQELLDQLNEQSKHGYVGAYNIALIHLGLGENDRAFEWLDKAYEERSNWLSYVKVEPRLDPLRSDPRFNELVRRIGFP